MRSRHPTGISRLGCRSVVTVVLAAALTGCGGAGDDGSAGPTSVGGTASTAAPGTARCVASDRGYELEYPKSWFTNTAGVAEPCRFFHPEPFTLRPQTEVPDLAISIRLNPVPFDRVTATPEGSPAAEVVAERPADVDGREALRQETVATGRALLPKGTRAVTWFVDVSDGTIVATTSQLASAGSYEGNVTVLDGMVRSLRIAGRTAPCSAGRWAPDPSPQPELPQPVSAMRMRIVEAAKACDFEALAKLALAGDSTFTYSFGGGGRPAAFWREGEAEGQVPLLTLVEILDGPFATRSAGGTTQYLWPSAYAFERWEDVPREAREELRRIYDERELQRFEQFGSYIGHRVGITGDGDWIFFVGGD